MFDFEKLEIWNEAIEFADKIKNISKDFPREEQYCLTSQIIRSSISISANIAEGKGRYTFQEFIRFLYIARGSLYETVSLLKISLNYGYLDKERYREITKYANILSKRINKLIETIKSKKTK